MELGSSPRRLSGDGQLPPYEDSDGGSSDDDVGAVSGDAKPSFAVRARCADGTTHDIAAPPNCTVKEFKDILLRGPMESSKGKMLRLIHAGRMLSNDGQTLRDAGVGEGHCVHVVASNPPRAPPAQAAAAAPPTGEAGEGGGAPTGFDRLRAAGLSTDDVQAVRTLFAAQVYELNATVPQREGEDMQAHFRRLEDVWMSRQGPNSDFALNLATRLEAAGDDAVAVPVDGDMAPLLARMREERLMDDLEEGMTYRRPAAGGWGDFVWGFLLGFTMGFLMLFWAAQRFVPRMQKLGIVAGVMCNVSMTAMRQQQTLKPGSSGGASGTKSGT